MNKLDRERFRKRKRFRRQVCTYFRRSMSGGYDIQRTYILDATKNHHEHSYLLVREPVINRAQGHISDQTSETFCLLRGIRTKLFMHCFGLNYITHPNSCIEAVTPAPQNANVFGDKVFKEGTNLEGGL